MTPMAQDDRSGRSARVPGSGPPREEGTPALRRRVTVAHPRTQPARNVQTPVLRRPPVADDLRRQTPLGDVYLRSLMRTQLRLGLAVVGVLAVLIAALPFLFAVVPAVGDAAVAGVPVPWLVIGVAIHPVILGLAFVYQRQARSNERDFAALVEDS